MYDKFLKKKMMSQAADSAMMGDDEKQAKMSVLNQLRDMANQELGGKLKGIKKVSVMSNSPEGLEAGLDKAKDVVEDHSSISPEETDGNEHSENMEPQEGLEDMDEHAAFEQELHPEMSEAELDRKMAELMMMKAKFRK